MHGLRRPQAGQGPPSCDGRFKVFDAFRPSNARFVEDVCIDELAHHLSGFHMIQVAKPQCCLHVRECHSPAFSLLLDVDLDAHSVKIEQPLGWRELNNLHLLLLFAKNPCREFGKGL
jgi:hypothetical protein